MTYAGFLLLFLVVPILVLTGLSYRDRRQGRALPAALSTPSGDTFAWDATPYVRLGPQQQVAHVIHVRSA